MSLQGNVYGIAASRRLHRYSGANQTDPLPGLSVPRTPARSRLATPMKATSARYDGQVTTPAGSRLLSRTVVAEDLVVLLRTRPGRSLFLFTREPAEASDFEWEIWHPVAEAWKDRSLEDARVIVNVRFGDGRSGMVFNADEAIVIATLD